MEVLVEFYLIVCLSNDLVCKFVFKLLFKTKTFPAATHTEFRNDDVTAKISSGVAERHTAGTCLAETRTPDRNVIQVSQNLFNIECFNDLNLI
jgi:hypothetical protein